MLNICLDDSAYCSIINTMEIGTIKKENVVLFDDDLSVGNISNCKEYKFRKEVIHNFVYECNDQIDDNERIKELNNFYKMLVKEKDFIIWYANNPRDYCNLYYIVSLIKNNNIKVIECKTKTKGNTRIYYKWVGEVLIEDMPMFLNQARELNKQEKDKYDEMWGNLVSESGLLRADIFGKIETVDENYYDDLILKKIPRKNIRIVKVIGDVIGQDRPCLNDWFIVWRIKRLAEKGYVKVEYTGEKRFMLNYIRKLV